MRKLFVMILAFTATLSTLAQQTPATSLEPIPKKKKEYDLSKRAADHFMFQIGFNSWLGAPDSIANKISGLQRSANVYIMLDRPFKGNQQLSIAAGIGIGMSNIYFEKMNVDIGSTNPVLPFINTDSTNNYKKYKVTTAFLEAPLELRYTKNPSMPNKTLKAAVGIKFGTLLNAHTKGKNLRNSSGNSINTRTDKVLSKNYFNSTRLAATARVGYGNFTLFGAYGLTGIFKDGVAANMNSLQIGLTISGL
ncbi:MAG: outer membrane beta-barrel protein [Ferruginibacter sp.]